MERCAPGSEVAVVSFCGSFCPITLAHAQCMVEARNVLVGSSPSGYHSTPFTAYAECITLVQANADDWLAPKLKATDEQMIARGDREYLIRLATSDQACIHTLVRSGDGFDPNTADTLAIALELPPEAVQSVPSASGITAGRLMGGISNGVARGLCMPVEG